MNVTTPIPVKTFQESPIVENHIDINEIEEEIHSSQG